MRCSHWVAWSPAYLSRRCHLPYSPGQRRLRQAASMCCGPSRRAWCLPRIRVMPSAIAATVGDDVEVVLQEAAMDARSVTSFADLCTTPATDAVDKAMAATGPDTIAKFLFTSGSTRMPKAAINTNRMWCANQQQMTQSMPVLAEQPLVLVDWLPWNHTFGGNHNFGMVLSTMAAPCTSTTASRLLRWCTRRCAICARSRPRCISTCPPVSRPSPRAMQTDDLLRKHPVVACEDVLLCRRCPGPADLGQPVRERGARDRHAHRHEPPAWA
jgi:hypothetical protein